MRQLSSADVDRLSRELGSYVRAGVPMPTGLRRLEEALRPGAFRDTVSALAGDMERGTPLSEALSRSQSKVPADFIALVRCGEISGDLDAVLRFSVDHGRRIRLHRSALITALVYPAFVGVTLVLVSWFVLLTIVPKFMDIYQQLGAELPWPTQFVVSIAHVVASPFGTAVVLVLVLGPLIIALSPHLRERLLDQIIFFPGMRGLVALSDTALSMRFVGLMAARAVPLADALRAASLAVLLPNTRASLQRMGAAAEQGGKTAPHLSTETPSTAAWLFARAEERGDLPVVCEGIAADCEDRFERLSKRAIVVLEPLLILIVALALAYLVISLYLPLFNIPKIVGRG